MSRSTLTLAKDLEDRGFTKPQAECLAEAIFVAAENNAQELVTKDCLKTEIFVAKAELKLEIAAVRTELKAEIAEVRTELKAEIAEVRTELKADIAETRTEIRDAKIATIKWMIGLQFVGFGLTVGFIYFLLNFLMKHSKLLEQLLSIQSGQ